MRLMNLRVRSPRDFSPISEEILQTTLVPQFESTVERQPENTAISADRYKLSYRELNNSVNHLAHEILDASHGDTSPIAILLDEGVLCLVAALAAMKCGRPYVMLPPGGAEEVKSFFEDSRAGLLVTDHALGNTFEGTSATPLASWQTLYLESLNAAGHTPNPGRELAPNAPFAIYYTSGSTGRPKGVLHGHLSKSSRIYLNINVLKIAPSDRVAMLLSIWHSGSVSNTLATLVAGATLYPLDLRTVPSHQACSWLAREAITAVWFTPAVLRSVLGSAPEDLILSDLRFIRLGGETISSADVDLFKRHTSEDCLLNLTFSCGESSAVSECAVYHDTPPFEGVAPAGLPLPGVEVFILDDDGRDVPAGEQGEICVSSPYFSLGYWNNPELTARVFRPHPRDPRKRLCHTGDVGRWRQDGMLEILGRKDTQVKIRGFRVQLEAVDLALRNLSGVEDAATITDASGARGPRLIAYVTMQPGQSFSATHLRRELSRRLPSYAVPSTFVQMQSLPRRGIKVARLELPAPSNRRPELEQAYVAPRSPLEAQIASIWERLLGVEGVGVEDNYFELGGDSLSAAEMTLDVEKALGQPVPSEFFKHPTIASLIEMSRPSPPETREPLGITPSGQEAAAKDWHREKRREKRGERRREGLTLRKVLGRSYSGSDLDRVLDQVLSRYVVGKPYPQAVQWALSWSHNPAVLNLLYRRRAALFARWVETLEAGGLRPAERFPSSVFNNLLSGLKGRLSARTNADHRTLENLARSPYPYWRTLGAALASISLGHLPEFVHINGQDQLMQEYRRGKGVILVSFHGLPNPARLFPVERLLGLERIRTISYHVPRRKGKALSRDEQVSDETGAALNAEAAQFAARLLQAGNVIQMLSDTQDSQGRTYRLSVAGRAYQFKAGFAELAWSSGAAIVPHWRYFRPDGSLQYEFGPLFESGGGDRARQIENLLHQYAHFVENTWATHPEAMRWSRMQRHLKRPRDEAAL